MTLAGWVQIAPGYGRQAVYANHAVTVDFDDEVAYRALLEHGDDLDLSRDEQERILQNIENGRVDPWNP